MSTRKFIVLNVIGAAVWSVSFACGGYLFGAAMETFLAGQQKWIGVSAVVAIAMIVWIVRLVRRRTAFRKARIERTEQSNAESI